MNKLNSSHMMTLQDADSTSGYHKPKIARALERLTYMHTRIIQQLSQSSALDALGHVSSVFSYI